MHGLQDKSKFSRLLLVRAIVAVFVLNWWVFQTGQASASPVQQTAQQSRYRTGGYIELRSLLRQKLPGSVNEVSSGLAEIAQGRPGMAVDLAEDLGRTDAEKAAWAGDILKQWAGRDPQSAWDWLGQQTYLTDTQLANGSLVSVVMDAMAGSDPKMLVEKVNSLLHQDDPSSGPLSVPASVYLGLQALIESGHAGLAQTAVEAWANDPLQPKIGAAAYEFVAMALAKNSPQTAAAWLRSLPASDDRNSALVTFTSFWGQSDPAAAMHWAETLAPQEGQPEVISQIFSGWMRSNAAAAMNWLGHYTSRTPAFVESDLMIGSLVLFSPAAKNDPKVALKLSDKITNPQTREIYQEQVYQSWGRRDPAAAIDYLQQNPMIASEQKKILIQQIQEASQQAALPDQMEQ
jgi:hypothetical protein